MKPNVFLPIVFGVLVGGGGAGLFLISRQKPTSPATVAQAPKTKPAPVESAKWSDPAGFSFDYPKDVSVNPHKEDQENYAHVELTHKAHPGRIIVWMKDLPAPDLAGWIKKEKRFSGASVLDTTLGSKPAKKILISSPNKMIVVGAIDVDVLVTVEGELVDSDYWSAVHQGIVDSFTFTGTEKSTAPAQSSDEGGSVDEEEVLE